MSRKDWPPKGEGWTTVRFADGPAAGYTFDTMTPQNLRDAVWMVDLPGYGWRQTSEGGKCYVRDRNSEHACLYRYEPKRRRR